MRNKIIAEVERLLKIVNLPMIECRFTHTNFTAGSFNIRNNNNKMYFNFNIKIAENNPNFISRTVVHEVAHYVNYMRGSGGCHDASWKRVMFELGAEDTSLYHNYDVSSIGFKYVCECCNKVHMMTINRHNKAQNGAIYICSKCNGKLILKNKT